MEALQTGNRIRRTLKSGQPVYGVWQTLPGARHSRALAKSGVDFVLVDCEHGNLSDDTMHEAVAAISAMGVSAVVRIPEGQTWLVKRALDTGAHGIMVPQIRSVQETKELVSVAKYPPTGVRGFGVVWATETFVTGPERAPNPIEYLKGANDSLLTCVQIEISEALADVENIARVPGVDVLFVGPNDLGVAIGHPILGPEWDKELVYAVDRIKKAAKEAGVGLGMFCMTGKEARKYVDMGFDMVNVGIDIATLIGGTAVAVRDAKTSAA